jgi:hypothetical protein
MNCRSDIEVVQLANKSRLTGTRGPVNDIDIRRSISHIPDVGPFFSLEMWVLVAREMI